MPPYCGAPARFDLLDRITWLTHDSKALSKREKNASRSTAARPGTAGAALVSCNTPPQRQSFPEITFQHLQPFRLDVARVQIVDGYQPDPGADIGSQFPEAPAAVARQWAEDRLTAVGQQGEAIYTITLAKAIQTQLRRSQGVEAMTHKDQSDRYDLAITVISRSARAENQAPSPPRRRAARRCVRTMTLNQREGVLFNLLDVTMKDMNTQLEKLIPHYLGGFVR